MQRKPIHFFIGLLVVLGFAQIARPDDAVIKITNYVKGILNYQLGGGPDPWSDWLSTNNWDAVVQKTGVRLCRTSQFMGSAGQAGFVREGTFYPSRNIYEWNAGSPTLNGKGTLARQMSFYKRNSIGALIWTFDSDLYAQTTYPDRSLNFDEYGIFCGGVVSYIANTWGIQVPFVEIGNEMNGGGFMGTRRANTGLWKRQVGGLYDNGGTLQVWSYTPANFPVGDVSYEYLHMFQAASAHIKAVSPGTRITAFPQAGYAWDFMTYPGLFFGSPRPDGMSFHVYPNTPQTVVQTALDQNYQYGGWRPYLGGQSMQENLLITNWAYTLSNASCILTEWNYDAGQAYANRGRMWDVVYYVSSIAKMVNTPDLVPSLWAASFMTFFPGGVADHIIDNPNQLGSMGLGMSLFKSFSGPDKRILKNTVTVTDAFQVGYLSFPRVECIAVRDNSTFRLMLMNDNTNVAFGHKVTVSMPGLTNQPVVVSRYFNKLAVSNNTPNVTNMNLVAGSFSVYLPSLGIATVLIPYKGISVTNIVTAPRVITNSSPNTVIFTLKATPGAGSVTNVSLNLTQLGNPIQVKMTNISGATLFRYAYTVPAGQVPGVKVLPIVVYDSAGNVNLGHTAVLTNLLAQARIVITNMSVTPSTMPNNTATPVVFLLTAKDLGGGTITNVNLDLTTIGGLPINKMSNISGSTLFRFSSIVPIGMTFGPKTNAVIAYSSFFGTYLAGKSFSLSVTPLGTIPGIIQAVDYDLGGEQVAYTNTTRGNQGGFYRNDDVDIYQSPATEIPFNYYFIGNANWGGDWQRYTVNVLYTGNYYVAARFQSGGTYQRFHIEFDGVNKTGPISNVAANLWKFNTVTVSNIALTAGMHQMKVVIDNNPGSGIELGYYNFAFQSVLQQPDFSVLTSITNVTLRGNPTGGKWIPGSTAVLRVYCTNVTSSTARSPAICQRISTNTVYVTNSSAISVPLNWIAEWSTNKSPNQGFNSPNYTSVSPSAQNVRWIRWKKTAGGPMAQFSAVVFRYAVTIK